MYVLVLLDDDDTAAAGADAVADGYDENKFIEHTNKIIKQKNINNPSRCAIFD